MRGYGERSLAFDTFGEWRRFVENAGAPGREQVLMLKAFFDARSLRVPKEVAALFPGIDPGHSRIRSIISGGQSGADLAGNAWAQRRGIRTSVRAFPGFAPARAEDAARLAEFPRADYSVTGTYVTRLRARTMLNVSNSDATLIIARGEGRPRTAGSALTLIEAARTNKPVVYYDLEGSGIFNAMGRITLQTARRIVNSARTLNVAGTRDLREGEAARVLSTLIDWE